MASIARPVHVPIPAPGPTLERDYPRVMESITAMWGFKELNQYFRKLTIDERGDREGFPPEVWDDLRTLQYLHELLVPETAVQINFRR